MTTQKTASPRLDETRAHGVALWNDSCGHAELADAVAHGFVGATSNPVIVGAAVESEAARWLPVLDALIEAHPHADEDAIASQLVAALVRDAAALLLPAWTSSKGAHGWLSAQVSAKHWRDADAMVAHGKHLAGLADNVAIKAPTTAAGLAAMEELVAGGVRVNATVSFSVAQAVAAAEAIARGEARGGASGSWVTIMIGRVDDHVKREGLVSDEHAAHAGIAVFKRARAVFRERSLSATLLAAAYRHEEHWRALVGPGIVQSIPYAWWPRFAVSAAPVTARLDEPVAPAVLDALRDCSPAFRAAYEDDGLAVHGFASYGASVHTLRQFLDGNDKLVRLVRDRMLPP